MTLLEFSFLLGVCGGTCFLVEANSLFISPSCIEWPFANLVAFVCVGCEAVSHLDHSSFCVLVTFSTIKLLRWTTTFGICIILMTESCDL